MIKSFRHKGLERFFTSGKKSGIRPDHAKKLQRQLAVLDNAQSIQDLPQSWKAHLLSGMQGSYDLWVERQKPRPKILALAS